MTRQRGKHYFLYLFAFSFLFILYIRIFTHNGWSLRSLDGEGSHEHVAHPGQRGLNRLRLQHLPVPARTRTKQRRERISIWILTLIILGVGGGDWAIRHKNVVKSVCVLTIITLLYLSKYHYFLLPHSWQMFQFII